MSAPAAPAAAPAAAPPTPAPLQQAWDVLALTAAPVRLSGDSAATARLQLPPSQGNRLSGLQIDPFSSGADVPLPGMGAPPSLGVNLHSALDELGSSMLRDLLDSPPAANGHPGKGATRQANNSSWNLGPAVSSNVGVPAVRVGAQPWGTGHVSPHSPVGAFGGVDLLHQSSLRDHTDYAAATLVAPLAAGGGAAPCAPWWQSGGSGALGSLPFPSCNGLPPHIGGAVPASPPLGSVLGSSPQFRLPLQPCWGDFRSVSEQSSPPSMAGLPQTAQFASQRRRDEPGRWSH
jgi:hypothetical protein